MNEDDFLDLHGADLAAARAARGPCPSSDALLDLASGALAPAAAAEAERHAALCATCAELVERLRAPAPADEVAVRRLERALDRRSAPWRRSALPRWGAAAAAVAVAVGAALLLPRAAEPPRPVVRGGELALAAPLGEVSAIELFRWEGAAIWSRYRVEVRLGAERWSRACERPELEAPPEWADALRAAGKFRWRVVALGEDGAPLAESAWAEVTVRAR
jgi:hypothetical protein